MRILLVDVDSLRPDHLGCYGYSRDTSPTIDSIADEGVRFDRCYASDTPCLPSRTALATGRFGVKNGVVSHFGEGQWYDEPGEGHTPDPERPLAFRHLPDAGIHTTTVSSFSQRHMAYHFGSGFRESIQPTSPDRGLGHEWGEHVTREAKRWLDGHAEDDDWLLHVQYWDPHVIYPETDEHLAAVRDSGPRPDWPDQDAIDDQQGMTGTRTADTWYFASQYEDGEIPPESWGQRDDDWTMPESITDRADVERVVDGYDASIRKTDDEIRKLLAALERVGVRDETAVVVTGDHGDAMGEHGIYGDHVMAHPPTQQVPLVVSWPDVTPADGAVCDGQVYQFDLVATICDLLDVRLPEKWDAEPFTPALRNDSFAGREQLVCGHGTFAMSRAVYRDDWVYIRLLHPGVMSYPGMYNDPDLPGFGLELLHDRAADSRMTRNLVEERPDVADELRCVMDGWVSEQITTTDATGTDPLARMATTDGPFLYNDPAEFASLYRTLGRSEKQIETVERSRARFASDER
ncbi:sulfatase [Halobium palmae]|uniref:Sulfatase n=1 Tax=Halobium palmae TaxID=1776492 RepID=A0ABD5RWE8_9EURY